MKPIRTAVLVLTLLMAWSATVLPGQTPGSTGDAPLLGPLSSRLQNERTNDALQKVPPFKVFDNLYYVGVGWVGSWLVVTNDGLILIDTLEPRYVEHLIDNIGTLGFDAKNVKHVVVLQAHFDHLGGAALFQQKYGAAVWMGEGDWDMLAQQPAGRGAANITVPKRDRVARDGDTLTLGNTSMRLYSTPGHTPGTTSLELTLRDGNRSHRAFFFGGSAPGPGRAAAEQFLATLSRVETLAQGAEVRLVNHGFSDAQFWDRVDRLTRRKPGEPHPFVAPDVFLQWFQQLRAEVTKQIGAELSR